LGHYNLRNGLEVILDLQRMLFIPLIHHFIASDGLSIGYDPVQIPGNGGI